MADAILLETGDYLLQESGDKILLEQQTYSIAAAQGSYTLTGQATGLIANRIIAMAQGSYVLTGQAAGLAVARLLAAVIAWKGID